MRHLKRLVPRMFLIIAIFVLLLLINQRERLEYYTQHLSIVSKVILENINVQMYPPRKFVGTKIQKEDMLKMYVGEPFKNFSFKEWEQFWQIIYGLYRKENPQDPRLPAIYRHLDKEEMQQELIGRYPTPFSYFGDAQWEQFWQIIFSK